MSKVIEKVKLIKVDSGANNNKVWLGELYCDGTVICEWGRVGKSMQSKTFPNAGSGFLRKKENEKIKKGYKPLNVIDSEAPTNQGSSRKIVSSGNITSLAQKQIVRDKNPIIADLIRYLSKENAHQIIAATSGGIQYNDTTGLFSTPLGVITQDNVDRANILLGEISDFVANNKYDRELHQITDEYMTLVPTDIGMKRLDVNTFWSSLDKVREQKQILDGLQASVDQALSPKAVKSKAKEKEEKIFDISLDLVEDKDLINRTWEDYYETRDRRHPSYNCKPKQMWKVDIASMTKAYENHGANMDCKLECYHGSSSSNLLSIFAKGMIIVPSTSSNVTGRMYGDGLYGAPLRHKGKDTERIRNSSTKALNYSGWGWRTKRSSRTFMFLVEFAMGKYYTPNGSMRNKPPPPYDSTWAYPNTSGVMNHEVIVYKTSQCQPKYLIEFE